MHKGYCSKLFTPHSFNVHILDYRMFLRSYADASYEATCDLMVPEGCLGPAGCMATGQTVVAQIFARVRNLGASNASALHYPPGRTCKREADVDPCAMCLPGCVFRLRLAFKLFLLYVSTFLCMLAF